MSMLNRFGEDVNELSLRWRKKEDVVAVGLSVALAVLRKMMEESTPTTKGPLA